jgi:hypothetical protein
MHLKTLFNDNHSLKKVMFHSYEYFHDKNDAQVYCGINSLHKRLNT